MFQIEIDIDARDGDAFDDVFWRFCAERLTFQPEPEMVVQAFNTGRAERRKITFKGTTDAMAFRRQWSLFEDAGIDWTRGSSETYVFGPFIKGLAA